MMRVLALTKYGDLAASTRQRFLQYEPMLRKNGIELECSPLLGNDYLTPLLRGEQTSLGPVARGYARRLRALAAAHDHDLIWVQYELFPFLPGCLEAIGARRAGKPVVLDYDDAIFHKYDGSWSQTAKLFLDGKLEPLMKRSAACICGNSYLRDYAAKFCRNSTIIPTVVDTDRYQPAMQSRKGPIVIGWIGSPSTWPNVRPLLPTLQRLCAERGTIMRAVGAGRAAESDRFEGLQLVDWHEAEEVSEIQRMDIGIMPLVDQPFERGKCGYKLIQYMACGLPVVGSPVGVNRQIVSEGENGFLATTPPEWELSLRRLIDDAGLRAGLGANGRRRVVDSYSLGSQAPKLIEVLKDAQATVRSGTT